jgi:hypothetical protein
VGQSFLGKGYSREAAGGWRGSTEAAGSYQLPSRNPRSDASREELAELAQQANPEEIQLGEDEDEDEMDLEPNGQWPAQGPGLRAEVGHPPSTPTLTPLLFPHRSPTGTAECTSCCVREPKGRLTPSTLFLPWSLPHNYPSNTSPLCTSRS